MLIIIFKMILYFKIQSFFLYSLLSQRKAHPPFWLQEPPYQQICLFPTHASFMETVSQRAPCYYTSNNTFETKFIIFPLKSLHCAVRSLSVVILWTIARQAPLSMGFFKQEYWSGLPFPSPGDLPGQISWLKVQRY